MIQFILIWWRFKIFNSCPSSYTSPFFCPKLPIRLISRSRIPPSLESAFSLPRALSAHPHPQAFTANAELWYFIPKTGLTGELHGAQTCPCCFLRASHPRIQWLPSSGSDQKSGHLPHILCFLQIPLEVCPQVLGVLPLTENPHTGCPGPQAPVSTRTTKNALTAHPLCSPPPSNTVHAVFTTLHDNQRSL